jgi:hypothetical protein
MPAARFATAVTCIDGRVHEPLAAWVRDRFRVDFVDLVTEPGADRVCAHAGEDRVAAVLERVAVSANAHASRTLVVAGHADCAANPVDDAQHRDDIRRAVLRLRGKADWVDVVGAWIDEQGVLEVDGSA